MVCWRPITFPIRPKEQLRVVASTWRDEGSQPCPPGSFSWVHVIYSRTRFRGTIHRREAARLYLGDRLLPLSAGKLGDGSQLSDMCFGALRKRVRSKEHLRFVAQQPCLICGRTPSQAHHIRYASHLTRTGIDQENTSRARTEGSIIVVRLARIFRFAALRVPRCARNGAHPEDFRGRR